MIEITTDYLAQQGLSPTFPQRFWAKVQKTDSCWLWTANTINSGYGLIGRGGRGSGTITAHRASWILHYGAVPDGLCVLHRCDVTGTLDLSGLSNLTQLDCSANPNLTALTLTGCTALTTLDLSGTGVTPSITGLASCQATLQSLTMTQTPLVTLDLTGFASLTTLGSGNNNSLETVILDGCVGLAGVLPFTNNAASYGALLTLNLNGCTGITNSDCDQNSLLDTLVLSGCTNLLTFDCNSCALVSVNLTGLTSLTQFICGAQTTLTTLTLTNCTSLNDLEADSCSLTGVDIGDSSLLTNILLANNKLTSADVDGILTDLIAFGQPAGYIEMNNQTPLAPANPVLKATLEGVWGVGNVFTD